MNRTPELKLIVYQMGATTISPIGILQEYISLSYTPCFDDIGSFELNLPFSVEAMNLVQRQDNCEKLVLLEDGICGICHKVQLSQSPSEKTIKIKGQLAEGLLDNFAIPQKIVPIPYSAAEAVDIQYHTYAEAERNWSSADGTWWRGVEPIIHETDSSYLLLDGYNGGRSSGTRFIRDFCMICDKGYSVRYDDTDARFKFQFLSYADRTVNQSTNPPVLISTKLGSLYSSKFVLNSQNWKNIVFAVAKYSYNGNEYTTEIPVTYDEYTGGISDIPRKDRRAVYVEMDLTAETVSSVADVNKMVKREAKKILYEYALVKSYDCSINPTDNSFIFGVDYFLGDKVTIYDEELQLQLDAQVKEYTMTYSSSGKKFEPVFGFSQPTLNRILKQKGVI